METIEVTDKRSSAGYVREKPEVHGKVEGFVPSGDYVLIRRNESIDRDGMIVRPEISVEPSERGVVIAVSHKAAHVPVGAIAKFAKYGAEKILFDDAGDDTYVLVRHYDLRGWHLA